MVEKFEKKLKRNNLVSSKTLEKPEINKKTLTIKEGIYSILSENYEEKNLQKRKPIITGHLWNHWAGMANDIVYFFNPPVPNIKEFQEESVYGLTQKIDGWTLGCPYIRKIEIGYDLNDWDEREQQRMKDYDSFVEAANKLLKKLRKTVKNFPIEKKTYKKEKGVDMLPNHKILFDNDPTVLSLINQLKDLIEQVNEFLYGKPCEFFTKNKNS